MRRVRQQHELLVPCGFKGGGGTGFVLQCPTTMGPLGGVSGGGVGGLLVAGPVGWPGGLSRRGQGDPNRKTSRLRGCVHPPPPEAEADCAQGACDRSLLRVSLGASTTPSALRGPG